MKLDGKIKRLVDLHGMDSVMYSLLKSTPLEKLILVFSNQCIFKFNTDKSKKRKRTWYKLARVFHRAYDEVKMEKAKKKVFKSLLKEVYQCQGCKKQFKVDPFKEENCKFDLDRGMVVVKCPNCDKSE